MRHDVPGRVCVRNPRNRPKSIQTVQGLFLSAAVDHFWLIKTSPYSSQCTNEEQLPSRVALSIHATDLLPSSSVWSPCLVTESRQRFAVQGEHS